MAILLLNNILDIHNMYNMGMKPSSLNCARRGRHNFWENVLGNF